ncbi:SNF2-related protein [Bacillus thuringiensis]|uniref:SNF2-related protein n=1 Tax=Bacillus thuringiensis TaxID=1428 RepID=UPI001580372B|nr:SNF2-related protein [Bacillus thuringiensis]MED2877277.1 SNF2-related protein [Bacillus thuringiensis]NUH89541.1 DEAD/DEAH box helicase family protein [Bacillus thuringiensis]NUH95298.1 DEAD/DEAH box helicase family protein [Bacillus thuringiensis]NUI00892.1 DEAD/DEAH box helicase family protein [Bacillus thuringiensis]NUI05261.1 DEAD/DEAH box helicase family protein [Bacillus thuringiensis]
MLKNLQGQLKSSYNSMIHSVSDEFYNPILGESISYKRVSGYFSCKALSIYAEGLDKIDENDGYVQFIISQNISEKDFEEIKAGYHERLKGEILTQIDKQRLGNLAYLISQGKADVKFGLVKNGLFHTKWGLFEDKQGDIIYFNGSLNETANAIENNFDSFDVDFSWDVSINVRSRINQKVEEFNLLWNDNYPGVQVIDATEIIYPLLQEFDIGKIQKIPNPDNNSVIFDMNDMHFFFVDKSEDEVSTKKTFKNKFGFYVDEDKGYPFFRGDLTYREIETIIELANKQADKHQFNFIVSSRVDSYINGQKYSIEEYRKSGLTLKDQDSRWDEEFEEFKEVVEAEVSRPLKALQLRSAMYMLTQKRAANFSVPGAGKTAMLLGVFAYLNSKKKRAPIKRLLVVSPINAFMSWKDEFQAVFQDKKDLMALSVHDPSIGGNRYALEAQWPSANLILINYESLPKFKESIIKCLANDSDTMLVYDEVHRVKGVQAKRALAALEIADKVDYRYVLTGTPIPNGYLDIYNFLNILFKKEYSAYFGFEQNMLKNPDSWEIDEINEKLAPYFWRTSKEDLGVPPADKDNIIKVPPSQEQLRLAEILYTKTQNPLATWIRMIQLSTNPEIVNQAINYSDLGFNEDDSIDNDSYDQVSSKVRKELEKSIHQAVIGEVSEWDLANVPSPKFKVGIELVLDIVKEHGKVVVWGLFVNTLKKITRVLNERGINTKVIYGGTPRDERDDIIRTFKENTDEIQVLVSNPNTLGESVSLHHIVHDAIYFEYNYNLTFMLQSRDRIHRLGLPKNQSTRYYYLMTVSDGEIYNFIDQKIYEKLAEKEARMREAIDGGYLVPEFVDDEIEEMKRIIASERRF